MNILQPYAEIWEQKYGNTIEELYINMQKQVELAGRTCYKSNDKITDTSYEKFIDMLTKNKHTAMLEHGTIYLTIKSNSMYYDIGMCENDKEFFEKLQIVNFFKNNKYSKVVEKIENNTQKIYYITTNFRVITENTISLTSNKGYTSLHDIIMPFITAPTSFHEKRITVHFATDIGVTREANRHRVNSVAEQSTRYCVTGDTMLTYKNLHNKFTIDEFYNNVKCCKNGAWKRIKIENLNEYTGELVFSTIKNIFYNGVKNVYEIKTKLGYSLKCTLDHKIYSPNGYIELKDLNIGDKIYVNGIETTSDLLYRNYDWLYNQNITLNKTFVQISKEFGYNISTLKKWARKFKLPHKGKGYFNIGKKPWNKGILENNDVRVKKIHAALRKYHFDGSKKGIKIFKEDTTKYQKYIKSSCEICGAITSLVVHHINKKHYDNNPNNLMTLCESCHSRIHNQSLTILHADEIISITEIGKQDVYDLEMNGYSNYVANGIIVHNCNYSKDKFDNKIAINQPSWINDEMLKNANKNFIDLFNNVSTELHETVDDCGLNAVETWLFANYIAEWSYMRLSKLGWKPQQSRTILPLDTHSELIHTAFVSDWKHFINLRSNGTTGAPHPDMKKIADMLKEEFTEL